MFAYNLRSVGKNKVVVPFILIALFANALLFKLIKQFQLGSALELFIPNVAGGLILIFPVWDHYLSEFNPFQAKNIWIPLIVTIVLWGGLYASSYLMRA